MKKILCEKGNVLKKITSWILIIAILFTSIDMSAFVVSADEQEAAVFSDDSSDSEESGSEIQKNDNSVSEVQTPDSSETDPQISFEEEVPEVSEDSNSEDIIDEEAFVDEDIFTDGSVEPPAGENGSGASEKQGLTVKIFQDENKNGIWDEGEAGIRDLEVSLMPQNTEEIIMSQSVSDGVYTMDGIPDGIYTVRLSAAPEAIAPYNLAESVNLFPHKDRIRFPDIEDTWFLCWTDIDVAQTSELLLGLQKDDLEEIEQDIGDAEVIEGENGEVLFSDGSSVQSRVNISLWHSYIKFFGSNVYIYYDDGTPFNGAGDWCYIHRHGSDDLLYCIEPFVASGSGSFANGGDLAKVYGAAKAKRLQLYAYYGSAYPWANMDSDDRAGYYLAAQKMIWEETGAKHVQWSQCICRPSGCQPGMPLNSLVGLYENRIRAKIANHDKMPSIATSKGLKHDYSNLDRVYEYSDTNKVLGNGKPSNAEGWVISDYPAGLRDVKIVNNKLQFKLPRDSRYDGKTLKFKLKKKFPNTGNNQYYVSTGTRKQSLLSYNAPTELSYSCNIYVSASNKVKIKKTDDEHKTVSGVTFRWGWSSNDLKYITEPTGTDGCTEIRASVGDRIYIQEYSVPEYLEKDETVKSIVVRGDSVASVTFVNKRVTRKVALKKVNAETGVPVGGARFQYWDVNKPDFTYRATTDSNGEFTSSIEFPVGTRVTMKETAAAPGYELPSGSAAEQTITISSDQRKNVFQFTNIYKKLPIQIKKLNFRTDKPIGGVEFKIGPDLRNDYEVLETGKDGIAKTKKYPVGTKLYYQEVSAPSGFKVDSNIYSVIVNDGNHTEVQTITVFNEENPLKFSIKKKGDDGRALAGVRFRLEKKTGNSWYVVASNLVTGRDGSLQIPGSYERELIAEERLRLVEEETVPGYNLMKEPFVFDKKCADSEEAQVEVIVINEKIPTSVQIYKKDADQNTQYLAGAVFEITDSNGRVVETLITDSEGSAYTENLLADTSYYIEEVSAPYGYEKVEGRFPLVLNSSNQYSYSKTFENKAYYGQIKLHKKDQNGRAMNGIEFTIYKGYLPVETLITDEKGYAESRMLPATDTYRIVETYAPPQYVSGGLNFAFKFLETEDGKVEEQNNWTMTFDKNTLIATFDVRNEEILGKVTIEKVDSEDKTVKVKGAEFSLVNRYTGEKIDTGVTDSNGVCIFQNVPLVNPTVNSTQGHYYIEETSPGENHLLPENTRKYFSLTVADRDFKVQFENPPYKGAIEITKVDEDDHSKKLEGAEFAIYRADDLNTKLKTTVTGKDGIARFDDLRYGEYVIKETQAPQHYGNTPGNDKYWDETVGGYRVTINEDVQVLPLEITNPRMKIRIHVVKKEQFSLLPVGGVEFEVRKADGKVLDTLVTTPDGNASSRDIYTDELGEGAYLIETKAPIGYEDPDGKHYPIAYDSSLQQHIYEIEFEIFNKLKKPELKIHKVDEDGEGVPAEFEVKIYNRENRQNMASYLMPYEPDPVFEYLQTTKENPVVDFIGVFDKLENIINRYDVYAYDFEIFIRETRVNDSIHIPNLGECAYLHYNKNTESVEPWRIQESSSFDRNTLTLTVVNKKKPVHLNIIKMDASGYTYLPNAKFRIVPDNKEDQAVEVTTTGDSQGVTAILPYAERYRIEEIQAPEGYFPMTPKEYTFEELNLYQDVTFFKGNLTLKNSKCPVIKIKKTDENGKPLDAEFKVIIAQGSWEQYTTTVTTENGEAVIDMADFEQFFSGSEYVCGTFIIREIKVDSHYQKLDRDIRIDFSRIDSQSPINLSSNDEYVKISENGENATVTVPNPRKNYRFLIRKMGENGADDVHANISIRNDENFGLENTISIDSSYYDITDMFSGLKNDMIQFSIEEISTDSEYKRLYINPAFVYYPNEEDDKKFQDVDEHIKIETTEDGTNVTFSITLVNERSTMRLHLKKTGSGGNVLAGAKFKVTTQNPVFEKEYVTTGDPNGEIFEFPYAQNIRLEEIEAPAGYETGEKSVWDLTSDDFKSVDSTNSVYECDRFFTDPIVNKNKYDLRIKKTDENGQAANATFSIVSDTPGISWEISTQDGSASLNGVVAELIRKYPDLDKAVLKVLEISTDEGLQLRKGILAEIVVHLDKIRGKTTGQYFELQNYDNRFVHVDFTDTGLEFSVENEFIPVNLSLIKKEEGKADTYLAGAEFTITTHGSDSRKLTLETTNDPKGTSIKLPWAESYSIQETKAPEGYILDPAIYDYTLKDFQDQMDENGTVLLAKNLSITLENTPIMGKIHIAKVDAEDNQALAGAVFEIYKGNLQSGDGYGDVAEPKYVKVGEITIKNNGTGISGELPYGDYLLKETRAPESYQITEEIYKAKISRDEETVFVQIPNKKAEGTIKIVKQDDSVPAKPLAGAVFTVHRKDTGEQVGDKLTTGPDGTVSMTLPYGEYYLKEVSFPSGYVSASGKTYDFILSSTQTEVEKIIPNTKSQYALRLFKTDRDTGEYLAGAVFGLYEDGADPKSEEPIKKFTTNANGSAVVFLAKGGHYDIYELQAPEGYGLISKKFEIYVDDNVPTVEITVENVKQSLTIEIHKRDEKGNPLENAVFEIRNAKTGDLVVTTEPTGPDGKISVLVPAGDYEYVVTEVRAPDGYVLDATPRPVIVNKDEQDGKIIYTADPVDIINYKMNGNIKLVKIDGENQTPLEGAVFGIYNSAGELVDTLTTNSNGEAMSKNLSEGDYTLKELTPPPGYELSEEIHNVKLMAGENLFTVTAENIPLKGGFRIRKIDPEEPDKILAGAVFRVYKSYEEAENNVNYIAEQTTGGNGFAEFTDISYGTYYVQELKAPDGYDRNSRIFTVTVDEKSAENLVLTVENHKKPEKGIFRVRKTDADTGAVLQGAEFLVTGPNGYRKTYTTDAKGAFETEELVSGTYTVTETKAPDGYYISKDSTKTVKVEAGAGTSNGQVVEYEFINKRIQFPIRIVKTDNGENPKPLAGAVFELYRLNEQGTSGEKLDTLVTDLNGEATSVMLPTGRYEVKEVIPPDGYELSEQPSQLVEITEDTPEDTREFTVTFRNSPQLGSLKIRKLGLPDKEAKPGQGIPLAGAVFEAENTVTGKVYTAVSKKDGWAVFENLPFGIYNVRETNVPAGYENDSAYFETVEIGRKESGKDPVVIEKTAYNYKIYGSLSLKKTDSETGNLVAGATYGIYKNILDNGAVDPDSYMKGYDLVTVEDQEYVTSKKLELGTYYIKEIESPPGYKLNPKVYPATINEEMPVVKIDAEDEAYKGSVTIHKTESGTGKDLQDVVFALYTKENYDKLMESTEDHQIDVPADYLTTDVNGNAGKNGLVLGQEYVLVEFTAPPGYEMDPTPRFFTPKAGEKEQLHFHYEITNKKKTMLTIHKKNEDGKPISDVSFTIYSYGEDQKAETSDDMPVGVLSPEITGTGIARYDISDLEKGWYYVKETQGSEMGYEVSQEIVSFEITDEKQDYEFTFINYRPKGEIEIQKKDELGNALPGAEFALYIPKRGWFTGTDKNDIEFYRAFEMDKKGYGILADIPAGVYLLRETKAPEGYSPIEDILVSLYRDGEEQEKNGRVYYHYHADIVNKPITGWISIQKEAELDGEPVEDIDLSNARFEIRDKDGRLMDTLITQKDGTALSRELPMGTYTIRETEAPQGTVLNENEGTVTIDGAGKNDIYVYTHKNSVVKGRIQIQKLDGDTGGVLNGAEFDILKEGSDTVVDHLKITDHGTAISMPLPYGWYIIRETKAPDGYALQLRDIRCQIQENNRIIEITVENFRETEEEILVVKYDKDDPGHYLKGAEFKLYGDETLKDQIGGTFVTDEKGKIVLGADLNLQAGETYYLKEIKAPEGYKLDETVHSFTLDPENPQTIALYISNEKEKGYIRFEKTGEMLTGMEEDTSYPKLQKLIWKQQTLENAEIGIYAVDMVSLDGKTYRKGDLIQRLKSGEISQPLPVGRYQYKELSAPGDYILDEKLYDIEVTKDHVEEANAALAAIKNIHASVDLSLHKKFKDGNTREKFEKVVFGVFTASTIVSNNIQIPEGTLLGILRIDENGQSIKNNLKLPQGSYYVMELETVEGYILDGRRYPFTTGYQNRDQTIEISSAQDPIVNEPVYGTIRLEKTGDMFIKVEKRIEEGQPDDYQVSKPVYGQGVLKGAEVEIRAKYETTIDGTTYQPGEKIDTLISGEKDESIKLPLGVYTLVETKAPDGYILDSTPKEVAIMENEEAGKPSIAVHTLENKKAVPEIILYKSFFGKTDEEAKDFYTKVLFGIYAGEEIKGASSDAILKKDELVGLIRIDKNGKGTLTDGTVLPFGNYYVKELETAEGYQISEKTYSFAVTKDNVGSDPETGESRVVLIPGISEETPVVNLPQGADVPFAFRKIDEKGNPLAGATFRLYTCEQEHNHSEDAGTEGSCWKEIRGLSPKTSGEDGIVDFGILPDGTYQLKETKAPDGYVLPAGQWRFTVDSKAESGKRIIFTPTGGVQPPAFQKADESAVYQYQVINRRATPMPFTGGTGMLDYAAGGGILLALGELVNHRRKKRNKRKRVEKQEK